jgi:hypothetical protein
MTDDVPTPTEPTAAEIDAARIRRTRRALAFGVVMATIQMAILLSILYC